MPLPRVLHWPNTQSCAYFHHLDGLLHTIPAWFLAIAATDGIAGRKKGIAQNLGKREMQKKRIDGKRVKFVDAWMWDQLNAN